MSSVPHPCAGNLLWALDGDAGSAFPAPLDSSTYQEDDSDPGFQSSLCLTEDCSGQDVTDLDSSIGDMQPILDQIQTDDAALDTQVAEMWPGTDLFTTDDLEGAISDFQALQPAVEAPIDALGNLLGAAANPTPAGSGGAPAPAPVMCPVPTTGVYTLIPNTLPATVGKLAQYGPFPVTDWLLANGDSVPIGAQVETIDLACGDPAVWGAQVINYQFLPGQFVQAVVALATPAAAGEQSAVMAITFDQAPGTFYLFLDITAS